ncbi:zinc-binding alcohol dehydrogenase family protein [Algoriphagus sediminis]|uniref:Zinc-binding alcohol dehydrogenase family protein n=1 Tax=Algoriphagus sediminis TaxID=3057113 RepID=A0ABT7YCS6_9BACT|nr:zinc-binding alcohol dehydrogenase family protein [Algoriphagus sediminis]MDN3204301.1 zinc-binding alcohol dehydrogenase family protein [Algoriphagus sediminis]
MKALFLTDVGKSEIREIEKPSPGDEEILLKVDKVGFCGGDLNSFKGMFPLQEYPNILGHEVGGIVEEIGNSVPKSIYKGLRGTVYPYLACGKCKACLNQRPNACRTNKTMGVRRPGAMTNYIVLPWKDFFYSEKLSTRELALAEPLTVGFHAVDRGRVSNEDMVAVIGCGIVGLGAVAGAVERGAKVIAIDLDDSKIAVAKKIGAEFTANPTHTLVSEFLKECTSGHGPDVIIEAVGSPQTYQMSVEEVAFTGRVVCIGYAKHEVSFNTSLFVQKEIEILGSRNCVGREDFPMVIKYLESGRFPVEEVISKTISLDEGPETLEAWAKDAKGIIKIMIDLEKA